MTPSNEGKAKKPATDSVIRWGLLDRSRNKLDGYRQHIMFGHDCQPALFLTKIGAIKYRDEKYGYIRTRKDLRIEPHGWMLPKPIKLKIDLTEIISEVKPRKKKK